MSSKYKKLMNVLKGGKGDGPTEPPKEKTVAELQQEYSNLCARLGDAQYQIFLKEEETKMFKEALRKVNQEGAEAQAREAAAAKAAAEQEPTNA